MTLEPRIPRQGNFFVYKYKLIMFRIRQWLKSDPSVPVTVIATSILAVTFLGFYLIIDQNIGSSLSFAVTTAAFFVALMIFRIQTYTKPLCSLFIEPQFLDSNYHKEPYRILVSVNIDNVGQSILKSKVLNWTVSEAMKANETLHKVIQMPTSPWSLGVRDIQKHRSHSVELFGLYPIADPTEYGTELEKFSTKNRYYNSSTRILVEIETHGFIIKHIIGATSVYFSSEEVQKAINNAMDSISDSFKNPVLRNKPQKIERIWEHQSHVDRPPLG